MPRVERYIAKVEKWRTSRGIPCQIEMNNPRGWWILRFPFNPRALLIIFSAKEKEEFLRTNHATSIEEVTHVNNYWYTKAAFWQEPPF